MADELVDNTQVQELQEPAVVVEPIQEPIVETAVVEAPVVDIYASLQEQFGRPIDEDYLKTDYKTQSATISQQYNDLVAKTKEIEHIMANQDLLKVADYMKSGVGLKEALEALTINVDTIPQDQLILDATVRNNPYLKSKEDLELFMEQSYGIGQDLEDMRTEDPKRYFEILKNRNEAVEAQKAYLNNHKIELTKAPERVEVQQQQNPIFTEERLETFKAGLTNELNTFENITIGDVTKGGISKPYDKEQLSHIAENILFSGKAEGFDEEVAIIKGYTSKEIMNALYLLKNQEAHLNEFVTEISKTKSVEAIKNADELYNNVGGKAKEVPNSTRMAKMVDMAEQN